MINDNYLRLSLNQAPQDGNGNNSYPSGAGGSSYSANYIDLLQARDIGDGTDLEVQLYCDQALSTDQSWVVSLVVNANPNALAGSIHVASFGIIGGAASGYTIARKVVAGERLVASISPLTFSLGARYMYVLYTNIGSTTSINGRFTIDICQTTQTSSGNLSYPGGFSVT